MVAGMALPGGPAGAQTPSVARIWNEQLLAAIRIDRPHPPVHARNLFGVSAAMYDAWAAYDEVAVGYAYRGKHLATDREAARREAVSYAALGILRERFSPSLNAAATMAALDAQMTALGYDPHDASTDTATPAGVGNAVAAAVSDWFLADGSRQPQDYTDYPANQGGYVSVNPFLITNAVGVSVADINRWQRLYIANAVDQAGNPIGSGQVYLGAHWLGVRPFALQRTAPDQPWIDPGPPPQLGGASDAAFRAGVVEVIRHSSKLTPDGGEMIDISPSALGNNPLGSNAGTGHPANPATGAAYPPNVVKLGDFGRVIAEFWADGPQSETPPGHWNSIANSVTDHPGFQRRMEGNGPLLNALEWDVKLYFALNSALHDAACAAWAIKRHYDGWRPISAIRYMAQLGQSGNPGGPRYHANGLPLVPGLIEQVTTASSQPGQRHHGLVVDEVAILAWAGQPANPATQYGGVKWIMATTWMPFQSRFFVTPPFPGYISGHSTFSRSAAEVLAAVTGSDYFPGGLAVYHLPANTALHFENGPSQPLQLQWATYFDAADQAGDSRLWGGIHPAVDDFEGRRAGADCGRGAWKLAKRYFDGSIATAPLPVSIRTTGNQVEVRCDTVRGFYYKLQSSPDLSEPFRDESADFIRCVDSPMIHTEPLGTGKFFRYLQVASPAP